MTGDGDGFVDEEEKSSPVILDNVENFLLNIEEEIKNPEDNGDFYKNDFHNDVDGVDDSVTDKEVDDKHLILEQIELLELPPPPPPADRLRQGAVATENMKNKSISEHNPTKNDEETASTMDPMDVDYETETVRNVTKVMKIVDQKSVGTENPLQLNNDTKKKGERLKKLSRIRIQNARIKILSQVESESNKDDIVFIIYLNKTDSREIESNANIEDFIFQN